MYFYKPPRNGNEAKNMGEGLNMEWLTSRTGTLYYSITNCKFITQTSINIYSNLKVPDLHGVLNCPPIHKMVPLRIDENGSKTKSFKPT